MLGVLISIFGTVFLLWNGWNISAAFCLILALVVLYMKKDEFKKIEVPSDFHVIIVGSGVSGVCMGKKLKDLGIQFTILEKSSSLGGTWYDNTYPGCACDVPSHLYSYSFYLNPNWSRNYSKQQEILRYLQRAADKFGVSPHVQCNKRVELVTWNKSTNKWTVRTTDGKEMTANFIISGSGALHVPKLPSFPGMDSFTGNSFHTALWNNDFDPKDKNIAIVGTGASAVQAVPSLAKLGVKNLTVFQRTPCWSPPRLDYAYPAFIQTLFAWIPFTNILHRYFIFWRNELRFWAIFVKDGVISKFLSPLVHKLVRKHIKMVVNDAELAKKLTPSYDMGCKRITPSDDYLQTFNLDNVTLVTETIEEVTENGIKTCDGKIHEVDTIVYATGFDLDKSLQPFHVVGLSGKLEEGLEPRANFGITHPEFPNLFVLLGPGTGLGHNSIIFMIECQVNYAADAMCKMINSGAKSMVLKPDVLRNYTEFSKKHMKNKVFADNSQVAGWYRNEEGENWTLWPLDLVSYWRYTFTCDMEEYFLSY